MKSARKIASIALVVLSALLVFVGCDQGFDYPSIPTDGQILQKVNLVEGQVIPTDGFDVLITYLDGSSRTISGVSVVETGTDTQKNGVADNGEPIEVAIGKDSNHQDVKATGSISAEPVDHYDVEVVAGATFSESVTNVADKVSVSAVSASGLSYKLGVGDYIATLATIVNAPITDGTVPAVITVGVGNYSTTLNVVATPASADFVSIASIALKDSSIDIADIDYEELPVPSFDDVTIMVSYLGKEEPEALEAPVSGLRLFYVDENGNEITEDSIYVPATGDTEFRVGVEYNGTVVIAEDGTPVATVKTATLKVTEKALNGFDRSVYIVGETLPAVDPDVFTVILSTEGSSEKISSDEVVFGYYTRPASTLVPYTGTTVPSEALYIGASYAGLTTKSDAVFGPITPVTAKAPEYVLLTADQISLREGFGIAKQYYVNITASLPKLSASDVVIADTDELKDLTWGYAYSTTVPVYDPATKSAVITALDDEQYVDDVLGNTSLMDSDHLYIVAYSAKTTNNDNKQTVYFGYVEVPMVEAVAETMTLAVSSGDMYGDEIESAEVTFRNDFGIVSVNDITDSLTGYELIVDGKVATSWPTVTLKGQNVEVVYRTSTGVLKATDKISAGEDYIANPATDITVKLTENGAKKTIKIGEKYSEKFAADDFEATGTTASGAETKLTVSEIEVGSTLEASSETFNLPVRVTFKDNTGDTVSVLKTVAITAIEYVTEATEKFGATLNGVTYRDGGKIVPGRYTDDFVLTGYDAHKDADTSDSALIQITSIGLWRNGDFEYQSLQDLMVGDRVTINFAYVDGTTATKADDVADWKTGKIIITCENATE